MEKKGTKTILWLCALSTALLLVGCIKVKQVVLIMPDGSGRMDITFGVKQSMLEKNPEADDPTKIDMDKMEKESHGFVAFTKPKRVVENGWAMVSLSAYFDDIKEVIMDDDKKNEDGESIGSYVFAKSGDGFRLMIVKSMISDMTDNMKPEDVEKEKKPEMVKMMEGFELTESYTLPGKIRVANGYPQKKGRTAWVTIKDTDTMDVSRLNELKPKGARKITSGPSDLDDEQITAFKSELAAAKKRWKKLKAEMVK